MKNFTLLFCFFSFLEVLSQSPIPNFPQGQYSYLKGEEGFYEDFHKILIEKKLKPCSNPKEWLNIKVLVKTDDTAEVIKIDSLIGDYKCTYELAKEVVKSMPGWISAKINDQLQPAVASYYIVPKDLFNDLPKGYSTSPYSKMAYFPGGFNNFRNEVAKRMDISDFYLKKAGKLIIVAKFRVNRLGKIEEVKLEKSSGLKEYDEMLIKAIKSVKTKWIPGSFFDVPVNSYFRIPLSFTYN